MLVESIIQEHGRSCSEFTLVHRFSPFYGKIVKLQPTISSATMNISRKSAFARARRSFQEMGPFSQNWLMHSSNFACMSGVSCDGEDQIWTICIELK